MRVFLGTNDTASCLSGLALGLREKLGVEVTTMVREPDPHSPDRRYDIVHPLLFRDAAQGNSLPPLVGRAAWKLGDLLAPVSDLPMVRRYLDHDVFVFIDRPWLPERVLFPLLRRMGKRIVCYWLGSDVRHVSALEQEYAIDTRGWPEGFHQDPLEAKLRKIRWSELYADVLYSVPDQAGLGIRAYQTARIPFVSIGDIVEVIPARKVPTVIHAPSRPELKGTADILRAVDRLHARGIEFEFSLIQGVLRRDLLRLLSDTDIVVDELVLQGPGVLSLEAMAAGCAVSTHTSESMAAREDLPFVPTNAATIEPVLERLVVDLAWRRELASAGRGWVAANYGARVVAERLLRHLKGGDPPEHVPDFFLDRYCLPQGVQLSRTARRLGADVVRAHRRDVSADRLAQASARGLVG